MWADSHLSFFTPEEMSYNINWKESWVDLKAGLNIGERKNLDASCN
jgi:hypothetical protein